MYIFYFIYSSRLSFLYLILLHTASFCCCEKFTLLCFCNSCVYTLIIFSYKGTRAYKHKPHKLTKSLFIGQSLVTTHPVRFPDFNNKGQVKTWSEFITCEFTWPRCSLIIHPLVIVASVSGLRFSLQFDNILSDTDWDRSRVTASRRQRMKNQSDCIMRISTEWHVCICVWGRIECVQTCICVTHPWVVIEPPQGHSSRQSFTCCNNNWDNLLKQSKIYDESLRGGFYWGKSRFSRLTMFVLLADLHTHQSALDFACVLLTMCVFTAGVQGVRGDGAVLRGLCLWLRRRIFQQWGELQLTWKKDCFGKSCGINALTVDMFVFFGHIVRKIRIGGF